MEAEAGLVTQLSMLLLGAPQIVSVRGILSLSPNNPRFTVFPLLQTTSTVSQQGLFRVYIAHLSSLQTTQLPSLTLTFNLHPSTSTSKT